MTTPQTTATSLQIRRTYAAPRERVFRAWTDPAELKQWWRVSDDQTTPVAEIDLRPGGVYRLGMKSPDAEHAYVCAGTYREVTPPEKLVFTWSWETPGMGTDETLVTVEFLDRGHSTELVLTHERFPNEESRNQHNHGWNGCLDHLEKCLAAS